MIAIKCKEAYYVFRQHRTSDRNHTAIAPKHLKLKLAWRFRYFVIYIIQIAADAGHTAVEFQQNRIDNHAMLLHSDQFTSHGKIVHRKKWHKSKMHKWYQAIHVSINQQKCSTVDYTDTKWKLLCLQQPVEQRNKETKTNCRRRFGTYIYTPNIKQVK